MLYLVIKLHNIHILMFQCDEKQVQKYYFLSHLEIVINVTKEIKVNILRL